MKLEIVSVVHNDCNYNQCINMQKVLHEYNNYNINVIMIDNRNDNIGFAAGCNKGFEQVNADTDVVGFINPDSKITGDIINELTEIFSDKNVVITGNRFGKPEQELKHWRVNHFICGAAFFVRRSWFELLGGFDERYVWSHEELDFIRRTELYGGKIVEHEFNIWHDSPSTDNSEDVGYKSYWFNECRKRYEDRWNIRDGVFDVSVIIPSYGDKEYWDTVADRAIKSLNCQTLIPREIIRLHSGSNAAQCRNNAAMRAVGKYLIFLDCDDELDPQYIEQMVLAQAISPHATVFQPLVKYIRSGIEDCPTRLTTYNMLERNYIVIGAMVARHMFNLVGGFKEFRLEDWLFWVECWLNGAKVVPSNAVYICHWVEEGRCQMPHDEALRVIKVIKDRYQDEAMQKGLITKETLNYY